MNKPLKRFIALGLTISLASVPTLSEVSKANEVSTIQKISFSLLSTEIDEAMKSVKVDQLLNEDYIFTILEQPDIVDLEVIENLPAHQQTIREDAEEYLQDIKPKLIDLNERSILVAEYMRLYNNYFVSEIQSVQEGQRDEQEAKQAIEVGLQQLNSLIEAEKAEAAQTQKEIEGFLIDLEENYQAFEAGVKEAEEYIIAQEGAIAKEVEETKSILTESEKRALSWTGIAVGSLLVIGSLAGLRIFGSRSYFNELPLPTLLNNNNTQYILVPAYSSLSVHMAIGGIVTGLVAIGGGVLGLNQTRQIQENAENLEGAQQELLALTMVEHPFHAFVETTDNVITSLNDFTQEWDVLQSNIKIVMDNIDNENIYELKTSFEEASIAWEKTQNITEAYEQWEENTLVPDVIDLDEIDTEEEYEEALKEAYGVEELIDPSDLTEEELEEWLRDWLEEELDEAA